MDRKIEVVQALRGVAALLVVIQHASSAYLPAGTREAFLNTGAFGVDFFFLISGFIMTTTTCRLGGGVADASRFIVKRVCRIVPLYVIASSAYALVTFGVGYFADGASLLQFARAMLFVPVGPMTAALPHGVIPLPPGWTLNYEMLFYALFAVSLLFGRMRWIAMGAAFFTLLIAVPWLTRGVVSLRSYGVYHYEHLYANIATNPIMWLFVLGVGAAFVADKAAVVGRNQAIALSVLFWTVAIWMCCSNRAVAQGLTFWSFCLLGAFVTLLWANEIRPIRAPRPLIVLGNISYSLYLTHLIVFAATEYVLRATSMGALEPGFLYMVLVLALSIVFAYFCHGLIETRLSKAMQRALIGAVFRPSVAAAGSDHWLGQNLSAERAGNTRDTGKAR